MQAPLNLFGLLSKHRNRVRARHTFPSRCSNGNTVSGLEKLRLRDGVVHLRFKDPEEAVLAYLLSGLWTPQDRFRVLAEGTALGCHDQRTSAA